MRSCFKTKTLRQKHKDSIHDVLQRSVKFTGKQVQSIQVLEKQNKTCIHFAHIPILCLHLKGMNS